MDVVFNALERVDIEFCDFAPQVFIDTYTTGEIGIGFNQISILTKTGRLKEQKLARLLRTGSITTMCLPAANASAAWSLAT